MEKIDLGYLQEVFADRNWRSTSFAVWSENYSDSLFSRARIAEAWSIALAWREEISGWQVDSFVAKPEILISEKTEAQGGDGPECTAFHIVLSVEAFRILDEDIYSGDHSPAVLIPGEVVLLEPPDRERARIYRTGPKSWCVEPDQYLAQSYATFQARLSSGIDFATANLFARVFLESLYGDLPEASPEPSRQNVKYSYLLVKRMLEIGSPDKSPERQYGDVRLLVDFLGLGLQFRRAWDYVYGMEKLRHSS